MNDFDFQVLCAWHQQNFPGESAIMKQGDPLKISHSCCDRCLEILMPSKEKVAA